MWVLVRFVRFGFGSIPISSSQSTDACRLHWLLKDIPWALSSVNTSYHPCVPSVFDDSGQVISQSADWFVESLGSIDRPTALIDAS